jgi:tetratricopeptide (TPR) repeat protein
MRPCRLLILLAAVLVAAAFTAPRAHAADAAQVAGIKRSLQSAVNTGNVDGMMAARGQFDALSAAEPKSSLLHYWVAVCDWRLAPYLMTDANKEKGKKFVAEGIARANQAYELDPKFAEALALRCGLQGMSIQLDPSKAMQIGIQMGADMDRALDLAPKNPRVKLLDGINTLYKPGFVGGGAGSALKALEKAQALFAAETVTDATAPDWGKDDVYVWAGRAAVKAGDYKGARDYYQKALAANPDNGWVKHSLLPEVEKQLGAKANS